MATDYEMIQDDRWVLPFTAYNSSVACLPNLRNYSSFAMKREEVDKRYLNRNKLFCRVAGVWPHRTNISQNLTRTVLYAFSLSCICTQILRVIILFSPDILMEQCPFLVAEVGVVIKLANYTLNYDKLAGFVNGMYNDWDVERPPAEIEIMDVYGKRGALFTLAYIVTAMFGMFVFIMMPTAASVVVYFTRIENGTVSRYYIYPAYYPFDEDKYYIYFWMHMVLGIMSVVIVYCACDSLYLYGVQHGCGLLAIAGYRFESAVENYASGPKESVKTMDIAYKKVCSSIHGHKRALRFIQDIQELHSTYLAILIVLLISAFSITLVKTSIMEAGLEFYKYLGFLVIQLIHLFFVTSQGQFIQNAYDEIYNKIYAGKWYYSSRKTQMLYLLALRETLTAPILSAGGLMPLTLETFAEVLKASASYFTVLKSQ